MIFPERVLGRRCTTVATRNDATYASGRPGIHQYNNVSYLEDFSAGEDVVASHFAGFVS